MVPQRYLFIKTIALANGAIVSYGKSQFAMEQGPIMGKGVGLLGLQENFDSQ